MRSLGLTDSTALTGGIQIEGLGATDIDNQEGFVNSTAVSGLALELYRRMAKHYNRLDKWQRGLNGQVKDHSLWTFEPHVAEKIIGDWLSEHPSIQIFKECLASDGSAVGRDGESITYLETESGNRIYGKVCAPPVRGFSRDSPDLSSTAGLHGMHLRR